MMSAYSISNQDISLFLDLHFCSIQRNESTTIHFDLLCFTCGVKYGANEEKFTRFLSYRRMEVWGFVRVFGRRIQHI